MFPTDLSNLNFTGKGTYQNIVLWKSLKYRRKLQTREDRRQHWYDLKRNWTVLRHNGRFLLFYHWFQDSHSSNFVPVRSVKNYHLSGRKHVKIFQNSPRQPWSYISSIFHERGPYHWEVSRTRCRRKSKKWL